MAGGSGDRIFTGTIDHHGDAQRVYGRGNGLLSSVIASLRDAFGIELEIIDYSEHAIGAGSDVNAAAYVEWRADRATGSSPARSIIMGMRSAYTAAGTGFFRA